MTTVDWISIAAVFAVIIAFFAGRKSIVLFVVLCGAVELALVAFGMTVEWQPGWPSWLIMLAGVGLMCFGLVGLQIMVARSVSLRLLLRALNDEPLEDPLRQEMFERVNDTVRYRLGVGEKEEIRLTGFGWFVARLLSVCHIVIGSWK